MFVEAYCTLTSVHNTTNNELHMLTGIFVYPNVMESKCKFADQRRCTDLHVDSMQTLKKDLADLTHLLLGMSWKHHC